MRGGMRRTIADPLARLLGHVADEDRTAVMRRQVGSPGLGTRRSTCRGGRRCARPESVVVRSELRRGIDAALLSRDSIGGGLGDGQKDVDTALWARRMGKVTA